MVRFTDGWAGVRGAMERDSTVDPVLVVIPHKAHAGPRCFSKYDEYGYLMDRDEARLVLTARRLGVCSIKVEKRGTPMQHVDLCGRPLERAKALAEIPKGEDK